MKGETTAMLSGVLTAALLGALLLVGCEAPKPTILPAASVPMLGISVDHGAGETMALVVKWRGQPANSMVVLNCDGCDQRGGRFAFQKPGNDRSLDGYTCAARLSGRDGTLSVPVSISKPIDGSTARWCVYGAVVPSVEVEVQRGFGRNSGMNDRAVKVSSRTLMASDLPEVGAVWLSYEKTTIEVFPSAVAPPIALAADVGTACIVEPEPKWTIQFVR